MNHFWRQDAAQTRRVLGLSIRLSMPWLAQQRGMPWMLRPEQIEIASNGNGMGTECCLIELVVTGRITDRPGT
jgi:hypothetical protein